VVQLAELKLFWGAVDLHAHAGKKGIFIYGNHSPVFNEQVEAILYPKLLSLNNSFF
jgi:hypothetical protein